ncbi:MAG: hypothetical protein K2M46_10510 [Lachnospiraceae bacterium]|nr:hypothetical protein [Lachnospiraceae bacterium]
MENRKEQLIEIIEEENKKIMLPLIEKIVFLEEKLDELQKIPFFKTNPNKPTQQKILPAFKMYKEMLQQYNNCIKILKSSVPKDSEAVENLIDKWLKEKLNADNKEKDMDTG